MRQASTPRPSLLASLVLGLTLLLILPPGAQTHTGGDSVGVVIPPSQECPPPRDHCLERFTIGPGENASKLRPGQRVDLVVWNDDDEPHRIYVTVNRSADPHREATDQGVALSRSTTIPGGSSRQSEDWTFSIPTDAEALYVWGGLEGHEAEGEWMIVELTPRADTPAPDLAAMVVAVAGALLARRMQG